jgi:fructokinase
VSQQYCIAGLGELLWDLLPTGRQLGGAPANFAVMAARLGNHGIIASSIGPDEAGQEALSRLAALSADTSYLQTDADHPTGTVSVALREGQPEYVIHQPVAWDYLQWTPEWSALARHVHAVCFGTLAQRSPVSRETIHAFLDATMPTCVRVFDVNLRRPFFDGAVIARSLEKATCVKLNDAEMPQMLSLLGLAAESGTDESSLHRGALLLLNHFPLQLVCITMGAEGSLLVTRDGHDRHFGLPANVRDTVGAGDAFTAALVHYFLQGAPLQVLNEAGNRWGAWVASQPGAMPDLPADVSEQIKNEIRKASGK